MANVTQDSDFLTKNSSRPSREPYNLPSDEEFFSALIDYQRRVRRTMANVTQDSDFLTKNSSRPSREPYNLPSDEEFFSALVDYQRDVSSTVNAPAPAATSDSKGRGRGSGEDGNAVKLDPAWLELDLSLSDLLQVIRIEHQKSRGRGKG